MRKLFVLVIGFMLFSCQEKEVLLPKAAETVVSDVENLSPIYFFFKTQEKDTLIDVNRKNTISSTNWVFNIDKRLPLRLVIPEIKKLQNKKDGSAHKSETAENYFTYTDTIKKSLAFLPFSKVKFKLEKPDVWISDVRFDKNNLIKYESYVFSKEQLPGFLKDSLKGNRKFTFSFNKNLSFGEYIQGKLLVLNMVKQGICKENKTEYVY